MGKRRWGKEQNEVDQKKVGEGTQGGRSNECEERNKTRVTKQRWGLRNKTMVTKQRWGNKQNEGDQTKVGEETKRG